MLHKAEPCLEPLLLSDAVSFSTVDCHCRSHSEISECCPDLRICSSCTLGDPSSIASMSSVVRLLLRMPRARARVRLFGRVWWRKHAVKQHTSETRLRSTCSAVCTPVDRSRLSVHSSCLGRVCTGRVRDGGYCHL